MQVQYPNGKTEEKDLSSTSSARLEEIKEALQRLYEGKIRRITIYRKGPIQES